MQRTQKTVGRRTSRQNRDILKVLLGGMLGLVVAMGIGRFVFTPILPLMQRDLGMSNSLAGWLAGLNYLGYLVGAITCSAAPKLLSSRVMTGGALLASLATTLLMGVTQSVFWWSGMRFAGGAASAVLFIVISAEVADTLARRGYAHWTGSLFGGVGFGIALSGLMVPQLDKVWGWAGAWIGTGVVATILAITGITLGRTRNLVQPVTIDRSRHTADLGRIRLLSVAYFFEGLGYIVTATFIVAIIGSVPELAAFAPYCWVAVGLAAVPSTICWPYLARRLGNKPALLGAYVIQALGILVSIGADSISTALFAAISFGGTFMGIVAMTLAEGHRRMPDEGRRAAAVLTASFGIGQVLGPVLAGILADLRHGFDLPLLLAAACVLLGGLLIALDKHSSASCPSGH
jgi:predicted MFS family arabinose efflux permease